MKPLMCVMLAGVLLGGATTGAGDAEAGGRKHWKHRGAYDDGPYHRDYRDYRDDRGYRDYRDHRDDWYGPGRYITHREVHVIRGHYGPRFRHLPPGLRKHYYRRGYLPPGWHRRIEPYPVYVRDVVVLPHGYHRGIIDGHAVIYNSRGLIIDVAVLF